MYARSAEYRQQYKKEQESGAAVAWLEGTCEEVDGPPFRATVGNYLLLLSCYYYNYYLKKLQAQVLSPLSSVVGV